MLLTSSFKFIYHTQSPHQILTRFKHISTRIMKQAEWG